MVAIMKSLCLSFIVLASIATLFSVADANSFNVGGDGAWVVNPHESYNTWAASRRFQVNDTIYFKYAKESESVQQVTNADYDACNVKNPIEKFDNGETEVTLNRPGPFYFISGNQEHCTKGQKLIVFVLGIKNQPKVPVAPAKAPSLAQPPNAHSPVSPVAPAKAPSTAQPPIAHSPVSPVAPAKSPAESPKAHSPAESPKAHSPAKSPAESPKAHSPAKSPAESPKAHSPAKSPAESPKAHSPVYPTAPAKAPWASHPPQPSVSPSKAPTTSPATHPTPSKSPSPSANPPKSPPPSPKSPSPVTPLTPTAKPPMSPPATPADSAPTPSDSTPPADHNMAPAPSPKSAATVVTVTSVMTTLFGAAFTVLMFA